MPWRKREQAKKIANEILIEAAAIIVVFLYVCKPLFSARIVFFQFLICFFSEREKKQRNQGRNCWTIYGQRGREIDVFIGWN